MSIDSVNPALVPGAAGEREIAAFVAAWLRPSAASRCPRRSAAGRPSVVGVARGLAAAPSLMLCAHTDTVSVAGMDRPHEPAVRTAASTAAAPTT